MQSESERATVIGAHVNAEASPVPTATIELGTVPLDDVLGEGASAVVYSATLQEVPLAIKVLRPELAVNHEVLARFSLEIQTVNELRHPAVPECLGFGKTSEGLPFVAFARVQGETLRDRMTRGQRLSVAEGLRLLDEILDVLRLAHDKGVIHRDIKPSNIMIAPDGSAFLLDFGLAHLLSQPESQRTTGRGIPIGTPAYMPPEMARADREHVGPASDLFSLALSVASGIAGHTLREASDAFAMVIEAAMPPLPLRAFQIGLPVELEALLDKAMAERPQDRFRSAEAMQRATRVVGRAVAVALPVRQNSDGETSTEIASETTLVTTRDSDDLTWLPPRPIPTVPSFIPPAFEAEPLAEPHEEQHDEALAPTEQEIAPEEPPASTRGRGSVTFVVVCVVFAVLSAWLLYMSTK